MESPAEDPGIFSMAGLHGFCGLSPRPVQDGLFSHPGEALPVMGVS